MTGVKELSALVWNGKMINKEVKGPGKNKVERVEEFVRMGMEQWQKYQQKSNL